MRLIAGCDQGSHALWVVCWGNAERIAKASAERAGDADPLRRPGLAAVRKMVGPFDQDHIHRGSIYCAPAFGSARPAFFALLNECSSAFEWRRRGVFAVFGSHRPNQLPMYGAGLFRCGLDGF